MCEWPVYLFSYHGTLPPRVIRARRVKYQNRIWISVSSPSRHRRGCVRHLSTRETEPTMTMSSYRLGGLHHHYIIFNLFLHITVSFLKHITSSLHHLFLRHSSTPSCSSIRSCQVRALRLLGNEQKQRPKWIYSERNYIGQDTSSGYSWILAQDILGF